MTCIDSACAGKSTLITVFAEITWYFAYTIPRTQYVYWVQDNTGTLNMSMKKFDANKLFFDKLTAT